MNSNELNAFDRGYRLGKALPFSWYMAYMPNCEGVIIRAIDQHTLQPDDVVARTFKGMEQPMQFQIFLDQIVELAQGPEGEKMSYSLQAKRKALLREFRGGRLTAPEYMAALKAVEQDYREALMIAKQEEEEGDEDESL